MLKFTIAAILALSSVSAISIDRRFKIPDCPEDGNADGNTMKKGNPDMFGNYTCTWYDSEENYMGWCKCPAE